MYLRTTEMHAAQETKRRKHDLERLVVELSESEERFRSMFENNHTVMLVIDPADGTIIDANSAAAAFYGWSREDLCRRKITEINTLSAEQIATEQRAAQAAQRHFCHFRHRRADGTVRDVEVFSGPVVFGGRALLHAIVHDCTERLLADEKLRRSEENLRITLQSISDAVIATDNAGLITRMNPAAERLTGWLKAEAAGRPLPEVCRMRNNVSGASSINPVQLVMERGDVVGMTNHTTLLARDGREYQISNNAAPMRDPAGAIVGVVLVFSDVTEAYRMRLDLATTAELLERTGEMAKVGGWELDLRSMQLFWSLETCRIHEIEPLVTPSLAQAIEFYDPRGPGDHPVCGASRDRVWHALRSGIAADHGQKAGHLGQGAVLSRAGRRPGDKAAWSLSRHHRAQADGGRTALAQRRAGGRG